MNIKDFLKQHGYEFSIYLTAGAMILGAYLIIAKLMPVVMSCRVILD
jgi:hypothetical protein